MSKKMENGLFIFRRDLRIIDNNGLNFLSTLCNNIYTIFIFTPEQVGSRNKYKSDNAVQFMIESLEDLASEIQKEGGKLHTFYGYNEEVITDCIKAWDINLVAFNLDITPYSRERDDGIVKMCQRMKVYVTYDHDYYLHEPGTIKTGSGLPYQKFTPYYNVASKIKVQAPASKKHLPLKNKQTHVPNKITLEQAMRKFIGKENSDILVHGGRQEALKLLVTASKNIKNYEATHNDLSTKTSELSASIKFGCVSIREVYKTLYRKTGLIRQLYWRDFYANIMYEFPRVLGHSLKPKYDKIKWHHNEKWFKAWCEGQTGFPIVDAGMRQLNTSGYCHNRSRLIVASFLIKTLLIDWRQGEQYFAQTLTDYDVANNNGNYQWVASSGADSQPFFRIFNPWRQGEEFDPKCEYIKKWVPELRELDPKIIHNWSIECENYKDIKYPKPICNYEEQREKALKMYKDALY
jgi:deoxyribodipyrimidine photo-lyase